MSSRSKKTYPASSQQEGVWYHALSHGASTWNIIDIKSFEGDVEVEALKRALTKVFERHASLRTNFFLEEDALFQKINDKVSIGDFFEEESKWINDDQSIKKIIDEEIARTEYFNFDFEKDILIRFKLFKFSNCTIFFLTINHIIHDMMSLHIFWGDLITFYNQKNTDVGNAPPIEQYYEYAIRQRAFSASENYQLQKKSEIDRLPDVIRSLNSPFYSNKEKTTVHSYEIELPKELINDVKSFSFKKRVIFSSVFQLAYYILLNRYFGERQLLIANIVNGRGGSKKENQGTIGLFASRLANSLEINDQDVITDLLHRVNRDILQSLKVNIPLEDLMRESHFRNRYDLTKIQAGFNSMRLLDNPKEFNGLKKCAAPDFHRSRKQVGQYDINLYVADRIKNFFVGLELRCDPNFESIGPIVLEQYQQILKTCISAPESHISEIKAITKIEKDLFKKFNNTKVHFETDSSIMDQFTRQVKRTPENIAFSYTDKAWTYCQLDELSNQFARYLYLKKGVVKGDLVGVMMKRNEYLIPALFAVLKAGAAYVPIDPTYPDDRKKKIIADAGLKVLISSTSHLNDELSISSDVLNWDKDLTEIMTMSGDQVEVEVKGRDLAYVIYTSGSTGKPKGVMIEHRSVINRITWMQKEYEITERDVLLQKTPITFDVSVWELFWWSFTGASLCVLQPGEEKDPSALIKAIKLHQITTIHFVPSMLRTFMSVFAEKFDYTRLESLKQVFSSGEALKPEYVNLFGQTIHKNCSTRLINLYGPTEATVDVSFYECDFDKITSNIPIGRPINNTSFLILDHNHDLLPIGASGELCIAGVGLARGYINNELLTRGKFVQNSLEPGELMYKTGDLARWLPEGNVEFLGRKDEQVKIRGYRIELDEIENVLSLHQAVRSCAVIAKDDATGDKNLIAYIAPENTFNVKALQSYLRAKLPEYMVPVHWVELEVLPLTPSGKVDKKNLPDTKAFQFARQDYVPPRNETEKKIISIWKTLLGIKDVGIYDDFFLLGGHSLIATRVVSAVHKELGISIPIKAIFDFKTVYELASYIKLISDIDEPEETEFVSIDI